VSAVTATPQPPGEEAPECQADEIGDEAALESLPPQPAREPTPLQPPHRRPGCPLCGAGREGSPLPWICTGCAAISAGLPQPVPGYRVVKEVGRGTMGVVWLAVRDHDGATVALKTVVPAVQSSRVQVERFLREARILAALDHPHIVRCFETGEASGLAHAHRRGIVHRDIKPANLLIGRVAGRKTVKVADFGLARVYRQTAMSGLTMMGEVGGTPNYMPPEQITSYREARPPADQYSTAATLYHLLTGRTLFELPPPPACFVKILEERPVPLLQLRPEIPRKLAVAVHRALAFDPADRFESVAEFRQAITPFGV
jgi:serine/threonine-protein kinase